MRTAKVLVSGFAVVGVLAAGSAVLAQSLQRFPDVPPDHAAHEAIEWAAEVGVTTGYTDGTFKPERPLSRRHAVVFMERYYDEILRADESADFTRGDMMQVLYEIAGRPGGWNLWDSSQAVAVHAAANVFADNAEFNMWVVCYEVADDPRGKHLAVELILPDNAGGVAPTIQHRFSTEDELTASRWELLPSTIFAVRLHGDVDAWLDRLSEATSLELHVHYSDDPNPTRAIFEWSNSFVVGQVRAACEDDPAQGLQRFPDVPPDHSAHNAIQWAAEVGVTTGYTDGTFKPAQPLSKRHAVVFMERYYHEILRADESADFTRADMMQVLYKIAGKPGSVDDAATGSAQADAGEASDRAALVALYHATDGPNWRVNDNWLTDEALENWYGVTTDDTGRVVSLALHYNGLAGELPHELGDLDAVESVELNGIDGNNLDLSALSGLPELRHLSLFSSGISDLSGLMNLPKLLTLQLQNNKIYDLSPTLHFGNLKLLNVSNNPLSRLSLDSVIPVLEARGIDVRHHGYSLVEGDLTVEDDLLIYKDNLVALPVARGSGLKAYTSTFYRHFEDDFDFLVLVNIDGESELGPGGRYISVANDVQGIGQMTYSHSSDYGSAGKLHGIPYFSDPWWFRGIILHEMMHRWAAYGQHPLARGEGHFAEFSNIFGAFGGAFSSSFEQIVDLGDGQFMADRREWSYTYGPLELYFAGFISSEEVPDFWVAVDGEWIEQESGMFSATRIEPFTVSDVIAAYGQRVPDVSSSQRDFRAAVILLLDEQNPSVDSKLLESLSNDISWFSFMGEDEFDEDNFFEATGGRATLRTDGLAQSLKN